mmetsp:Transcript_53967/g.132312  ORF Transcript_53967/g.132312 Transcript_53967/m.132312 type:complete len:219 (+) Transcript_53967:468-1124(+)
MVYKNTQGPHVYREAIVLDSEHFRRRIGKSAANGRGHTIELCLCEALAETKVRNANVSLVYKYILRLQVAVDDVFRVEVLKGEDELGHEMPRLTLVQATVALEVLEEVAALVKVGDEVEGCFGLEGESYLDKERVALDELEGGALVDGVAEGGLVLVDLALLDGLEGVLRAVLLVLDEEDLARGTFADGRDKLKIRSGDGPLSGNFREGDKPALALGV